MSSTLAERPAVPRPDEPLRGAQRPGLFTAPPTFLSSSGQEAVELAAMAGLVLDPWQQHVLDVGLREREDGAWASFEVCVNVPRQNGKGGIIEARELAGLFLLGERLIIHSAHEFKTSRVAFQRIQSLILGCPSLRKRVKRVLNNTTETSITLVTGQSLQFLARSGGSGRGFTGDCNILDEAMILGDDAMGALMPTLSAVPNPQMWYLGSAGIGGPSVQLGRLRRRALEAQETGVPDPSLSYFEWSADPHHDECMQGCTEHDDANDPQVWAKANPALGIRIAETHVRNERASLGNSGVFERERLGVGEYPSEEEDAWRVIPEEVWRALTDPAAEVADPVAFAVDTTPERSHTAIGVAGRSGTSRLVDVADHRHGTGWVPDRVAEMALKWRPCAIVIDPGGPAGSLIKPIRRALKDAGLDDEALVVETRTRDVAAACGQFYDAATGQVHGDVTAGEDAEAEQESEGATGPLVHLDPAPLATALAGADKRPVGDGWAWARRGVSVDISPLMAVTLALWGHAERWDADDGEGPNLW